MEMAEKSLKKLRGTENIQDELKMLKSEHDVVIKQGKLTFREVFKDKATQRATIMITGIWFFFQMTGVNAILFYTVDIFEVNL